MEKTLCVAAPKENNRSTQLWVLSLTMSCHAFLSESASSSTFEIFRRQSIFMDTISRLSAPFSSLTITSCVCRLVVTFLLSSAVAAASSRSPLASVKLVLSLTSSSSRSRSASCSDATSSAACRQGRRHSLPVRKAI